MIAALGSSAVAGCLRFSTDAEGTEASPAGAGAPQAATAGGSGTPSPAPTATTTSRPDRFALQFNKTVRESRVNPDVDVVRLLAFACSRLVFYRDSRVLRDYDIGTAPEGLSYLWGTHGRETHEGVPDGTFRWFGGEAREVHMVLEPFGTDQPTRAVVVGEPVVDDEIEADVFWNGVITDHVDFGARDGYDPYEVSLVV